MPAVAPSGRHRPGHKKDIVWNFTRHLQIDKRATHTLAKQAQKVVMDRRYEHHQIASREWH